MKKISHLLCYAIVNVCKFCIYCWQYKCPTEIFHSCIYLSSRAVLSNKRNFIGLRFEVEQASRDLSAIAELLVPDVDDSIYS